MNLPLTVLSKRKEEPITASQLTYPSGFLGAPRSNKSQGCRKGTSLSLWPCPLHHWILLLAWGLGSSVDDEDKNWTEPRGSHCLLWAEAPGNPQPLLFNLYGWQQSEQISQIQQPCFKTNPKDIPLKSLWYDLPISEKLTPLLPKLVSVPWHHWLVPPLGLCSGLAHALQALPAPSHPYRPFPSSTAQFKTCLKFSLVFHTTSENPLKTLKSSSENPAGDSALAPLRSGQHGHVTFHVCELHPQRQLELLQHNAYQLFLQHHATNITGPG